VWLCKWTNLEGMAGISGTGGPALILTALGAVLPRLVGTRGAVAGAPYRPSFEQRNLPKILKGRRTWEGLHKQLIPDPSWVERNPVGIARCGEAVGWNQVFGRGSSSNETLQRRWEWTFTKPRLTSTNRSS
jgi:hypothetical protein